MLASTDEALATGMQSTDDRASIVEALTTHMQSTDVRARIFFPISATFLLHSLLHSRRHYGQEN
jgi:hypothetical protein